MVPGVADLADFPLKFDNCYKGFATAQPAGNDFLFTSEDGTKLAHEIVSWDPTQYRLVAFVRVPRLSPETDTILFLYWGNAEAQDQSDVEGTWDKNYRVVKHLSDVPKDRTHGGATGGTIPRRSFFGAQARTLEDLFGAQWFQKPSRKAILHPAYSQWQFCTQAATTGRILDLGGPHDLQQATIRSARIMRDTYWLVECTQGDVGSFRLGQLANYGDERVMRRLRSVILHPAQYEDVLAELMFAASQISRGHAVTASEALGKPDFRIIVPGWPLPILADSKRLSGKGLRNSINQHIKKTSKQIKSVAEPAYGLAILNVSALLVNPWSLSDSLPEEVVQLELGIRQELSKHHRSISAAVLVWDEMSVLGPEPNLPPFVMVAIRTRSLVVRHCVPNHVLPEDLGPVTVEYTVQTSSRGEVSGDSGIMDSASECDTSGKRSPGVSFSSQPSALATLWQSKSSTLVPSKKQFFEAARNG